MGRRKVAISDTVGRILTTRLNKLRDFAGGGKEKTKQWVGCMRAKDPSKYNKMRFTQVVAAL